jgi:NAD(P)H-hydrate epimerase
MENYDTIVDCVLGTGIEGELKQPYVDFIDKLNSLKKNVISCDVPSGFGTDHNVIANTTVTFHDKKIGMSEETCGRIIVADIGIPKEARTYLNKGDFLRYPLPKEDSHKGQNGRLVIVGGGPYIGAPVSAALAALRTGTDLVTIFTPKRSFIPIASYSTAYMVKELTSDDLCIDDVQLILKACENADALLIGPGLGRDGATTAEATRAIIDSVKIPIVIDADAISHVAGYDDLYKNAIFTPHKRELSRLIGHDEPSDEDIQNACNNDAVILRKGSVDRIYNGTEIRYNQSGCSGMTVGGTGDVLAGIVAGLLSKKMSNFDSACLGTHICGLAGEIAFEEHSYGMNSEDVIAHIGHVLREGLE